MIVLRFKPLLFEFVSFFVIVELFEYRLKMSSNLKLLVVPVKILNSKTCSLISQSQFSNILILEYQTVARQMPLKFFTEITALCNEYMQYLKYCKSNDLVDF